MSAFLASLAHLFALARGLMDWARERAREHAIRTAEADRITAEQERAAREAEHAANDELGAPRDRGNVVERLRRNGF
ncbi:MAG: hypothetical protein HEQ16_05090 [Bosea sp.]|jgi:hypothetical protein|nr:hypothetical protein [Bosea sp. (in: a-proteobacteria)]